MNRLPNPMGCARCGIDQRGHAIQASAGGSHTWQQPSLQQIRDRMRARRATGLFASSLRNGVDEWKAQGVDSAEAAIRQLENQLYAEDPSDQPGKDKAIPTTPLHPSVELRNSVAYHEAGHAIIGMTFGMSLDRLRIYTEDSHGYPNWAGSTYWNPCTVPTLDLVVELAAGEVAAIRYFTLLGHHQSLAASRAASPHDQALAIRAAARSGYPITFDGPAPAAGTTWERVVAAAEQAVESAWNRITFTAEALLSAPGHELSGAQVAALTGMANPEPSPQRETRPRDPRNR